MDFDSYRRLDALEIASLVRSGEVEPREVVTAALDAVQRLNPALNAVVLIDESKALAAAEKVDPSAPLAGVPFLVKDNNLFVEGWPTTFSSRFFEGYGSSRESEFIRRLRTAGVVFIGKTSTPEFASDWTTEPTMRGPTRNPWNREYSPGGSSGGSAAAVASGMVPVAHGNDNAGSIRVPAAVCGLFGLKPTRGLNPIGPEFPELAAGLNSEHVLTRSVQDSAALLDCLAGPELGGQYYLSRSVTSYLQSLKQPIAPLRVGYATLRPDGSVIDPEIAQATERVASILAEEGHTVQHIELPHRPELAAAAEKCWFGDIGLLLRMRSQQVGRGPRADELEAISIFANDLMNRINAVDYICARQEVHKHATEILNEISAFDLVITPTTAETAPRIGDFDTRTERFSYESWCVQGYRFAPFTDMFNATGQPAASVPVCLSRAGLPIGVQVVAKPSRDELVLTAAHFLERRLGRLHLQ